MYMGTSVNSLSLSLSLSLSESYHKTLVIFSSKVNSIYVSYRQAAVVECMHICIYSREGRKDGKTV